jgi:(E)-4-hydroxy-3-methyl-but-2-enyl pyrophosphate reductase
MKIYRARYGGVCFGVKRAVEMSLNAAKKWKRVYSLGPLIHNRLAVKSLRKKGIITVNGLSEIKNRKVIIRSHGIHPKLLNTLKKKKFEIIDATCPRVRRAQRYVEKLIKEGYQVIIVGEKDHPEVKGLLGYGGNHAEIYSEHIKLKKRRIGVVPQTTIDLEYLNEAISRLMENVVEIKVYNTICKATILRIHEAIRIAKKADAMLVVGGKNSANTTRLYQMCKKYKPAYHIESPQEISMRWFKNVKSIGVTAGASTPKEQVDDVVSFLKKRLPKKNHRSRRSSERTA